MGLLVVGAVAGILISLAWLVPSQGYYSTYISQPYFNSVVSSPPLEPKPTALLSASLGKATHGPPLKSAKKSSTKKHSSVHLARAAPAQTKTAVAAPVLAPDRPAEVQDTVIDKAKAMVAAKLENPASAEFSDIKRAMRKNMLGHPVDTICGHVKGKNASGGETGDRPFLYLVNEDEAYVVVDGRENSAAAIAYRNICSAAATAN
jgi:hypothetical protein